MCVVYATYHDRREKRNIQARQTTGKTGCPANPWTCTWTCDPTALMCCLALSAMAEAAAAAPPVSLVGRSPLALGFDGAAPPPASDCIIVISVVLFSDSTNFNAERRGLLRSSFFLSSFFFFLFVSHVTLLRNWGHNLIFFLLL